MTSTMRFDRWENPAATQSVTFDQLVGGTGLVPLVPSSVNLSAGSATVSASGLVTFSNTTYVRLNGIFSTNYRSYYIAWVNTASTSTSPNFEFSNNGTDQSSNYTYNQIYRVPGGSWAFANGSTSAANIRFATNGGTPVSSCTAYGIISNPMNSTYPATYEGIELQTGEIRHNWGYFNTASTTFNGMRIVSSANMTGTVQVYGYR